MGYIKYLYWSSPLVVYIYYVYWSSPWDVYNVYFGVTCGIYKISILE